MERFGFEGGLVDILNAFAELWGRLSHPGDNFLRWIVERLITVIGIVVSVLIVVVQIGKQFRNSQQLQVQSKADDLKLKIYETLLQDVDKTHQKITEAYTSLFGIPHALAATLGKRQVDKYQSVKENGLAIHIKHLNAQVAVGELLNKISRYEIVVPEFDIFKKVLNFQLEKARLTADQIMNELLRIMPLDINEDFMLSDNKTTANDVEIIVKYSKEYTNVMMQLDAFIQDLEIEAQNQLLGALFKTRAAKRQTRRGIVVSSDKADRIAALKYINEPKEPNK